MHDKIINIVDGTRSLAVGSRYRHVQLRDYPRVDLGVEIIEFLADGTCKAPELRFKRKYEDHKEVVSLSKCFVLPFWAGTFRENGTTYLQHPTGWVWTLGKKRLTYNRALEDARRTRAKLINIVGVNRFRPLSVR